MEQTDLKKAFLKALAAGDREKVTRLRRQVAIISHSDIPPFIEYHVNKDGMYCLSWKNKVISKDEFRALQANFPTIMFWHEEKTYPQNVN